MAFEYVEFSDYPPYGFNHNGLIWWNDQLWMTATGYDSWDWGIWSSPDGVNWTRRGAPGELADSSLQDAYFYILGDALHMIHSVSPDYLIRDFSTTDGDNWTMVVTNISTPRIEFPFAKMGNTLFIVGGNNVAGGTPPAEHYLNDVWTSSDGATWTRILEHAPFLYTDTDQTLCAFKNKLYLMGEWHSTGVAEHSEIWESADGVTWTQVAFTPFRTFEGHSAVTNEETIWLACNYGTTKIYESTDCITWTPVPGANSYMKLALGGGFLWASGSSGFYKTEAIMPPEPPEPPPPTRHPSEKPWYSFACTPYGQNIDNAAELGTDFGRAIAFDQTRKVVYPLWGFPFICTLSSASPCAGASQLPVKTLAVDNRGYIYKAFGESSFGLGTPMSRICWTLTAASNATILAINADSEGNFFPADFLVGLPIVVQHLDAKGRQIGESYGICASNTNDTLTPAENFETAPKAGDRLLVAPMWCGVLFGETRGQRPSTPAALEMNVYSNQVADQFFKFEMFTSTGRGQTVDLSAPKRVRQFSVDTLERGKGRVTLPAVSAQAHEAGLNFMVVGGGVLHVEGLVLEEII
jgi:hypothetical protein